MGIVQTVDDQGIAEVVMDNPPVNALTVGGWFDLARIVRGLGEDPAVRVVVLRAEGRGFNAGVDIKEMQATEGFDALIGANRGCYAAFAAVYECAVPVIAAVNGFCLGGGIGLVGNADVIVASEGATFGLRGRRCTGCRDASGPPRAPAPDAGDGLHLGHGDRGRAAPYGSVLRSCHSRTANTAFEIAGQVRREPHGHPRPRVARDRPDRREALYHESRASRSS
jgi:hypothetical protein